MKIQTIVHESFTPAKKFTSGIYLLLGVGLTGIGIYYFATQFNSERIEEWLPLGLAVVIGLYFLFAYLGKWNLPNSKPLYKKSEYILNAETNMFYIYFTSTNADRKLQDSFSLVGVDSFEGREERKSKTSTYTEVVQDGSQSSALGKASLTGTYGSKKTVTYTETTQFLIFQPSGEEIEFSFNYSSLDRFVDELNEKWKLARS